MDEGEGGGCHYSNNEGLLYAKRKQEKQNFTLFASSLTLFFDKSIDTCQSFSFLFCWLGLGKRN